MPLLDHFHPPLSTRRRWDPLRISWANTLANALNGPCLPKGYFAEALVFPISRHLRPPESALAECPTWDSPAPRLVMPAVFPGRSEVLVFSNESSVAPLAAIVVVSPVNKEHLRQRRAMAARCASYLGQGTNLILIDVVTEPPGNLHNEIMGVMQTDEQFRLATEDSPYAVAYGTEISEERAEIHLWPATFAVGDTLPRLPLALTDELSVPVDFEATYMEACHRSRLI
jgi:hypothetical protein